MSYTTDEDPDNGRTDWDEKDAEETEVSDLRCVWCKIHMEEWPDDLRAREIDTGEVLCENCLKDLRRYKRILSVQIVAHDGFGPAVRQAIDRHLKDMLEEVRELTGADPDEDIIRPPMDSNAHGRAPSQGQHPAANIPPGVIAINEEDLTDEEVAEIEAIVNGAGEE